MSKEERRSFIIEGLVDIGPKKAKALIDKFKNPYQVFKAMKQSMRERFDNFKALGDSIDDIAATLIYASEINKTKKHKKSPRIY